METSTPPPAKNKGGRPVGSANKLAMEARKRAEETGELPHEFLLRVARGEVITRKVLDPMTGAVHEQQEEYDFDARKDAAKAAAPYFAPKISTVEVIRGVHDDELDAIIAELTAQTGASFSTSREEQEDESGTSAPDIAPSRSRERRRIIG